MNDEHITVPRVRARVVKGWAFMNLSDEDNAKVRKFLATGNTEELPEEFKRKDYSIYYN